MKKIRMRLGFDIALGLLLIFEMLYTLTGNVLHELVGVVFFATMAAHLVFARKWSGSMVRSLKERQKLPGEQKARLAIAIALALCAVALAVSSVAISNLLGPSPEYLLSGAYTAWCLVHTVSAYGMCALAVVHLLLHWVFVAKVLKISYNPERRQAINTAMGAVAGVAAVAIGAAGLQAVASFADAPVADQLGEGVPGGRNSSGPNDSGRNGSGGNGGEGPDADGDLPADGSNGNNAPDSNEGEAAPSSPEGSEEAAPSQRNQRGQRRRGTEEGGDSSSSGEGSSSNGRNGSNAPDDGSASGSDGSNDRQPSSGNGSGSNGSNGTAPDSGNGSGSNGGNGSSTSDICTLCRKYCPLSAPRCNKPYAAGLI